MSSIENRCIQLNQAFETILKQEDGKKSYVKLGQSAPVDNKSAASGFKSVAKEVNTLLEASELGRPHKVQLALQYRLIVNQRKIAQQQRDKDAAFPCKIFTHFLRAVLFINYFTRRALNTSTAFNSLTHIGYIKNILDFAPNTNEDGCLNYIEHALRISKDLGEHLSDHLIGLPLVLEYLQKIPDDKREFFTSDALRLLNQCTSQQEAETALAICTILTNSKGILMFSAVNLANFSKENWQWLLQTYPKIPEPEKLHFIQKTIDNINTLKKFPDNLISNYKSKSIEYTITCINYFNSNQKFVQAFNTMIPSSKEDDVESFLESAATYIKEIKKWHKDQDFILALPLNSTKNGDADRMLTILSWLKEEKNEDRLESAHRAVKFCPSIQDNALLKKLVVNPSLKKCENALLNVLDNIEMGPANTILQQIASAKDEEHESLGLSAQIISQDPHSKKQIGTIFSWLVKEKKEERVETANRIVKYSPQIEQETLLKNLATKPSLKTIDLVLLSMINDLKDKKLFNAVLEQIDSAKDEDHESLTSSMIILRKAPLWSRQCLPQILQKLAELPSGERDNITRLCVKFLEATLVASRNMSVLITELFDVNIACIRKAPENEQPAVVDYVLNLNGLAPIDKPSILNDLIILKPDKRNNYTLFINQIHNNKKINLSSFLPKTFTLFLNCHQHAESLPEKERQSFLNDLSGFISIASDENQLVVGCALICTTPKEERTSFIESLKAIITHPYPEKEYYDSTPNILLEALNDFQPIENRATVTKLLLPYLDQIASILIEEEGGLGKAALVDGRIKLIHTKNHKELMKYLLCTFSNIKSSLTLKSILDFIPNSLFNLNKYSKLEALKRTASPYFQDVILDEFTVGPLLTLTKIPKDNLKLFAEQGSILLKNVHFDGINRDQVISQAVDALFNILPEHRDSFINHPLFKEKTIGRASNCWAMLGIFKAFAQKPFKKNPDSILTLVKELSPYFFYHKDTKPVGNAESVTDTLIEDKDPEKLVLTAIQLSKDLESPFWTEVAFHGLSSFPPEEREDVRIHIHSYFPNDKPFSSHFIRRLESLSQIKPALRIDAVNYALQFDADYPSPILDRLAKIPQEEWDILYEQAKSIGEGPEVWCALADIAPDQRSLFIQDVQEFLAFSKNDHVTIDIKEAVKACAEKYKPKS